MRFGFKAGVLFLASAAVFAVSLRSRVEAAGESPLQFLKSIPLPGVEGRFDHFALDLQGNRLFAAALGNGSVEVFDLKTDRRLHTIPGLKEPQGIAYAGDLEKLFVASGGDGTCKVFDGKTYELLSTIALGDDADNVRYDFAMHRIYVGYGAGALGVIDARTNRLLGRIELNAHPESFQLEKNGNRIFVNVPDANEIVVIDREKRSVVAEWPLGSYHANFPMALDEAHHRLFVGCRRPAELEVFDTESGKEVARFPVVGDTDDLWYDAVRRMVYVSGGQGFLDVIRQTDADHYKSIARAQTAAGARTSFFAADLNRLFLAVPQRGAQGAELREFEVTNRP